VRNLRDLTVEASTELERQMLQAVGALPKGEKSIPIKDNISIITLRNHVRYLCVVLGAEWSLGMLVQSAVSDLARFVLARGAARSRSWSSSATFTSGCTSIGRWRGARVAEGRRAGFAPRGPEAARARAEERRQRARLGDGVFH
jgi:hypothetical protein